MSSSFQRRAPFGGGEGGREGGREGGPTPAEFPRARRKKTCPFTISGVEKIDYKDVENLTKFITEKGKILPRRITGVSQHHQRLLADAIRRARYIGLLPFVSEA